MVAARIANLTHGGNRSKVPIGALSDQAAATTLNVGERSVERAKTVQRTAAPEIIEAVDRGHLAVSVAAEIASQPVERQAEIVATLPRDAEGRLTPEVRKALAPVIKEIRRDKVAAKKERRAEREADLGRKIQALPDKMFGVAIEDFEWDHEPWSRETGIERHPSMHYETAENAHTPEEIVARCANRFACLADDCILFKWATIPHAYIAMQVMALQGFRYVSQRIWNKGRPGEARGPGYWVTGEHEIVLIGVRGNVVPPAVAHFRSNFSAPVGVHSEKPDDIHAMIEFHWPSTPKVEFNARRARPGWTAWGFDAPAALPAINIAIADDGDLPSAVDTPAPPTLPPAPDDGKVEQARVDPDDQAETAVPPAGRPGPDLPRGAHPLDIPEFLRRTPKASAGQAEMDLARRDRLGPEIVDGALQTRLPLTDDEVDMLAALRAIEAGERVESGMMRHLIGAGFAHCSTTRVMVTDEGRAFLAQLVPPASIGLEARA
jgi:N6-adenosine-specific RNA methylase IME4